MKDTIQSKAALVKALSQADAYPHPVKVVRTAETHVSYLFFTGDYVYKVKKPVDYGFLDFTTLEKRRHFCLREVELNSRLSPEVYLGVVPVNYADGRYRVEGPGETVEHAVKMRQLPQDRAVSELLRKGLLTGEDLRRVAEKVAEFHRRAASGPEVTRHGDLEATRENVEENFRQTERYVGVSIEREAYEDIMAYSRAFMEARQALFKRRADEGRIRDGHGDLHSANIFMENGIHVIDCIEFNDRFRCLDVAEDVAFLAMDLDFYGRQDLSDAFISAYADAAQDQEIYALLSFYKSYRAYVRGKVTCFRLDDTTLTSEERGRVLGTARAYFELARRYALAELFPRPTLVLVAGLMGSGKTAVSEELSRRWGLTHVSSDITRKRLAGMRPEERRQAEYGQDIYSAEFSRRTYDAMLEEARRALDEGRSVILDATFRKADERRRAVGMAAAAGAPVWIVECAASEEETRRRLLRRATEEEQTASDGRWELFHQQRVEWEPVRETPEGRYARLDTSGSKEETVRRLVWQLFMKALEV